MHQRPHERLLVWQEAYKICLLVYRMTSEFPSFERFGLTSQLRRAATSVALNIAEGNVRRTKPEKARCLEIAGSSIEELHCAIRLSFDLSYIDATRFARLDALIQSVSILLTKLRRTFL
jgi:four helix bundle protein